ncbi:MAG TPA: hypothetical protein VLE02_01560 [Nitrosarchaeum sp.]|nr:hypothetical protein [Nitrosarchaeum sp.]
MGKYIKLLVLGLLLVGIAVAAVCIYKRESFGKWGGKGGKGGYRRWSKGLGGGGLPSYWDIPYYASAQYLGVNQDCDKLCTKNYKDCLDSNTDKTVCEKIVGACLDKC